MTNFPDNLLLALQADVITVTVEMQLKGRNFEPQVHPSIYMFVQPSYPIYETLVYMFMKHSIPSLDKNASVFCMTDVFETA